jgi:hypothetical protein
MNPLKPHLHEDLMMSMLLTNERKFILQTLGWGLLINSLAILIAIAFPDVKELFLLMIFFAYIILPRMGFKKRTLTINDGKYFNSDDEDITSNIPVNFVFNLILLIISSFVMIPVIENLIRSLPFYEYTWQWDLVFGTIELSGPLVVFYSYFYKHNLPIATLLFLISLGGNSSNDYAERLRRAERHWMTDPSYSYRSGNIYNSRRH